MFSLVCASLFEKKKSIVRKIPFRNKPSAGNEGTLFNVSARSQFRNEEKNVRTLLILNRQENKNKTIKI